MTSVRATATLVLLAGLIWLVVFLYMRLGEVSWLGLFFIVVLLMAMPVVWAGFRSPRISEDATERVIAGCTLACGTGVGVEGFRVQGCPPDCSPDAGDCVDKLEDLPCRTDCGDKVVSGGGGGW